MAGNANNKIDPYKTKKKDDIHQTKYVIQPKKKDNDNERPIISLVSGNRERKLKIRVETHHNRVERLSNLTAFSLFVQ